MADYTMRAGGTAADLAACTDGDPAVQAECMSIATHNALNGVGLPSVGDRFLLADTGGDYRDQLDTIKAGTLANPITYTVYPGDSPVIKGSALLTGATYKWTASGSGTNEFYCELSGGGDPSLTEPLTACVWMDNTRLLEGAALGALADHEWKWGDNDALGYSTVYIRDQHGDPDGSGVVIEAGQRDHCHYNTGNDYVILDGVDLKFSNEAGFMVENATTGIQLKNCTMAYHPRKTWMLYGAVDCTVDNVISEYCTGAAVGSGDVCDNLLVTGCIMRETQDISGWSNDSAGTKFFYMINSTIEKCSVYNNYRGGIRFDGDPGDPGDGCDNNIIRFCKCTGNGTVDTGNSPQIYNEFGKDNEICYNLCYDSPIEYPGFFTEFERGTGNIFHHNISYGTVLTLSAHFRTGDHSDNTVFYNNLAYGGNGFYVGYPDEALTTTIKNNIVVDANYADLIYNGSNVNIISDYNCFTGDGTHGVVREYATGTSFTLAQWQAESGQDLNTIESVTLTNAGSQDFTQAEGSACIDAGVDLGEGYDDGLDPTSLPAQFPASVVLADQDSYAPWEIGPYVYTAGGAGGGGGVGVIFDCDANGKPIVYEGTDARITGSNSDVSDDDDVTVIRDGTDVSLYVNGAQIGATFTTLAVAEGTVGELTDMAEGCASIEFWSLYATVDLN